MTEKEAIEHIKKLKEGILYLNTISSVPDNIDIEAIDTILQTLKNKDKRIDELEKALIEEQLKHTDKINKAIRYIEKETYIDYEREICHEMYEGQIFELIKILEE